MDKRIIFHVDVNNAFLSWSALDLLNKGYQVDIRTIPSVIGGDESKRRGIVLAKSPVAKKFGIVTAETLYSAREKCPNLKVYPPNYDWYYKKSQEFHNYLKQFTPNVEKYSVDEAFLDLSGMKYIYDDYIELANRMKNEIKERFGFTVNVGIANNMLCAKMASDFSKPDQVHTLFEDEIKSKMWPLPVNDLFMVGKRTAKKLHELDIHTIGDLAKKDISFLNKYFKNQGTHLKESANGIDYSKVEPQISKSPSISVTETLTTDVSDISILEEVVFRQTRELCMDLRRKKKFCNVVAVIFKNDSFESYTKQQKLDNATDHTDEIYQVVKELLYSSWRKDPIRLIGVRLADLTDDRKKQLSIFDEEEEENADDTFQKTVDAINNKFGIDAVIPASIKRSHKPKLKK